MVFQEESLERFFFGIFSYMLQIYEINPLYIWHKRIKSCSRRINSVYLFHFQSDKYHEQLLCKLRKK